MIKDLFLRFGLPIIALLLFIVAVAFALNQPSFDSIQPTFPVPESPFKNTVAGVGTIEPQKGTIDIGTKSPGIVTDIYVRTNERITAGQALFKTDDSVAQGEVKLSQARLDTANSELKNIQSQKNISNKQIDVAKAKVNEAQAALDLANTRLNNYTMTSPINGTVLKINVNRGENVQNTPVMVLGNLHKDLQVRVEVDEHAINKVSPHSKAVGMIRGMAKKKIPLTFIKEEPIAIPKKTLTAESNELIDTRVLQIVYSFDNTLLNARPGQQMDVFIEAVK